MHRIQRLLGRPQSPRGKVAPALLAGALAISIAVAIGATQPPAPQVVKPLRTENPRPLLLAQATSSPPGATAHPDLQDPYQKWLDQGRTPPVSTAALPQQDPYRKWLDEEVVYIISPEERDAFLALRTDEERQHFIEQFWQRRDPTPGTPENEFREEHYRRIAYANDHFSYPGTAGWRSDRGGIYIKFGPPDELESQPGSGATPPAQRWYYRYIEPIGANVNLEFVDPSRTGEYHMTTDPLVRFGAPKVQAGPAPTPQAAAPQAAAPQAVAAPLPPAASPGATNVTVASRVSGTISSIYVRNSQTVSRGQLLVEIDSGSDSPYNRILSPIDGIVSGAPESVGVRVQPGRAIMTLYDPNSIAATPAEFEVQVKAASYQAGWEAAEICFAQGGGDFNSCDDRLQGSPLNVAMRTLTRLVKQSGYTPTPEARNALANLRKTLDDLRAERLQAR